MIIVSNTSPITNLAAIGQHDLLHRVFDRVVVPDAVVQELTARGIGWPGAVELAQAEWIHVQAVQDRNLADALRLELDQGEAAAIVLALQTGAELVLLDEQAGAAARYLGLEVMGVVGILLRAKQRGYIPQVKPLLDRLRHQAGFFLSTPVYEHALSLAQE
jgi:hypothetical protein